MLIYRSTRRRPARALAACISITTVAVALAGASPASARAGSAGASSSGANVNRLFVSSATVNGDHTVTLPLRKGRTQAGRTVWFVVLDASDSNHADRFGANKSQKLANAGRDATQAVTVDADGTFVFAGTVDFTPVHAVAGTPGTGFPPVKADPGAVGDNAYSPLVRLPDGAILNAPQLANDSGQADKVVALDTTGRTVRYQLTDGFSRGNAVVYMSTDSSDRTAAALEDVTWAPRLNAAPFAGGDGTDSARASLAAFVNGPTGVGNPQRQGLNSTLLGEGDPRNVLAWKPNQGRYSPLWDVFLTRWAAGQTPRLQTEVAKVADLARSGAVTAPDGSPWGPSNFIVNCPIIAEV